MLKLEPFLDGKIVSNRLFLQKERKQTSHDKEVKLTFFWIQGTTRGSIQNV